MGLAIFILLLACYAPHRNFGSSSLAVLRAIAQQDAMRIQKGHVSWIWMRDPAVQGVGYADYRQALWQVLCRGEDLVASVHRWRHKLRMMARQVGRAEQRMLVFQHRIRLLMLLGVSVRIMLLGSDTWRWTMSSLDALLLVGAGFWLLAMKEILIAVQQQFLPWSRRGFVAPRWQNARLFVDMMPLLELVTIGVALALLLLQPLLQHLGEPTFQP